MIDTNIHTIDATRDADTLVDILSSGAIFPLVVTGSSMLPFLKEGRDTVRLQRTDNLYKGQIVFFRRLTGGFTLHRIRRIYPDGRLLINGDAQDWCEIIHRDQVLAGVISITRNNRNIDPNGVVSTILRAFWYPTRAFRPYIWKTYSIFRRIFKKH